MQFRGQAWCASIALSWLVCVVSAQAAEDDPGAVGETEMREEVPGLRTPADGGDDAGGSEDAAETGASEESSSEGAVAEPATEENPLQPATWAPPEPDATAFDWLKMNSGEWVKGEFKTLRDRRIQFESDEFDDLDLDWEDVSSFYLARPHSFRVQGRVLFGTAELRGRVLRIRTAEELHEFERHELTDVAQGTGQELDWWTLTLGAGATLRRGNTKQVDISGNGELRRETALTRFLTTYRGSFSKVDGDKTANDHRVRAAFNVFLTQRLYLTVPFSEYYHDELQNIDARVTSGAGVGYEFVRNAWVEMEASLGAAHQYNRLGEDVDENRSSHDFAVVPDLRMDFDFPGGTELDNRYQLQWIVTDFGKTNHHAESVLSLDVWGPLDLDVTFLWDRIEEPADTSDDEDEPKKDDFRLLVGFSLEF